MWTINDVKEEAPKEPLSRAPRGGFLILLLEMGVASWYCFFYIIGVGFLGASSVTSLKVQTVCNNESRYQYRLTSYFTKCHEWQITYLTYSTLICRIVAGSCFLLHSWYSFLHPKIIIVLAPRNHYCECHCMVNIYILEYVKTRGISILVKTQMHENNNALSIFHLEKVLS